MSNFRKDLLDLQLIKMIPYWVSRPLGKKGKAGKALFVIRTRKWRRKKSSVTLLFLNTKILKNNKNSSHSSATVFHMECIHYDILFFPHFVYNKIGTTKITVLI